jgi:hypothetical protein
MKVLYYVVYVEGIAYYFGLDELAKALDFSEEYWLVQMAYIDGGRSLRYRNYDRQKGEFVG